MHFAETRYCSFLPDYHVHVFQRALKLLVFFIDHVDYFVYHVICNLSYFLFAVNVTCIMCARLYYIIINIRIMMNVMMLFTIRRMTTYCMCCMQLACLSELLCAVVVN